MDLQQQIEEYKKYKTSYYLGEPLISDAEFDELEEHLILSGYDPKVGYDDVDESDKAKHRNKMLSLRKYQVLQSELLLEDAIEIFAIVGAGVLSWKYDGMAGEAQYTDGVLIKCVTRGDGDVGRDITKKMRSLIPNVLTEPVTIDVRFEIVMDQNVFLEKYPDQAHSRNLVAGIVRDENIDDPRKQDLQFKILEAIDMNGDLVHNDDLFKYNSWFMSNYKTYVIINSVEELMSAYNEFASSRSEYNIGTDGLVLTSNTATHFDHDGKYPDYALAIKFMPPKLISTVKEIKWNLKKSGRYIPSVHINPIVVDGRRISKANGHNIEYLVKHNLVPGTQVQLILSNDIIPMLKKL